MTAQLDRETGAARLLAEYEQLQYKFTQELIDLDGQELGENAYIVVMPGLIAISFEGLLPRLAGGPAKATRFTKEEATRRAACTFNGNKEPASAMHVRDALRQCVADLNETMILFQSSLRAKQ